MAIKEDMSVEHLVEHLPSRLLSSSNRRCMNQTHFPDSLILPTHTCFPDFLGIRPSGYLVSLGLKMTEYLPCSVQSEEIDRRDSVCPTSIKEPVLNAEETRSLSKNINLPRLFHSPSLAPTRSSSCSTAAASIPKPLLLLVSHASLILGVMALKTPLTFQSQKLPGVGLPSRTGMRSPRICMASTLSTESKEATNVKKSFSPRREVHEQITHSMPPQKIEVFKSLEGWAEETILPLLKPVEQCWQPQDFLPDPASEGFMDQVQELRARSREIPDDYFVCLVGDMITEEALPTYQTMLNTLDGVRDETGASLTSWAIWNRAWTAEENRHGDLLNKYLYLTGRVDMRQIEKTIQYLIGSGMDPKTENNPYLGFVYTSFQERATSISHGNTGRHAKEHGDTQLAKICGMIAADEKRHERAYTTIVEKLFEIDPDGAMVAFADMMKKNISMPAHLMYDGKDDNLFDHFSAVAQRIGVYTGRDYADILEFLVRRWRVEMVTGLSAEGQKAQDYVCNLVPRIRRIVERTEAKSRGKMAGTVPFSWVFDREVSL
ncbi:hypothetical protein H6P81_013126 [Aristolochia fimbriata]|uniref:Acyl-[acyl-carrier-protein] desaturase n=1 Tax=Aristolochia fimbriata TaxID=158543 RepID=A0AAV7EE26_ARIFI|nr:hypothetical protein H6P81_013126 [Aristolochia fimbriata]